MSHFSHNELAYLRETRLARIATAGADGMPHVAPVGMWSYDEAAGAIRVQGHGLEKTKKYRDVQRTGRAAIVIDDLRSTDPFHPRGIEVRGQAEAVTGEQPHILIHPERIVAWGIDSDVIGRLNARSTG